LAEVTTWAQLGLHAKPIGLLDPLGYFDLLLRFLDHAVDERFLRPEHRTLLLRERAVEPLLDAMAAWAPPTVSKWL
jgi:predicted Rossmann-fold nucleotide-binding protein